MVLAEVFVVGVVPRIKPWDTVEVTVAVAVVMPAVVEQRCEVLLLLLLMCDKTATELEVSSFSLFLQAADDGEAIFAEMPRMSSTRLKATVSVTVVTWAELLWALVWFFEALWEGESVADELERLSSAVADSVCPAAKKAKTPATKKVLSNRIVGIELPIVLLERSRGVERATNHRRSRGLHKTSHQRSRTKECSCKRKADEHYLRRVQQSTYIANIAGEQGMQAK